MNNLIRKLNNNRNSAGGFTLIELLIAASLTTIVVSLTGFGVVAITQNSKTAKTESERRVELNRALDFISDEIRQAQPIATNASANLSTLASSFTATGKTPVLTLAIPGVSQRVIYYIAAASDSWLGPNLIYRWGPNFNANGTYSNPTTPANWTYEPLADMIVNTAPSTTPTCPTGWSLNPPSASVTGFYACVDPAGRRAEMHLRGKLTDAYGTAKPAFEVTTQAFARPYNRPFTSTPSAAGSTDGTINVPQASTAYFEILGGSLACSATGPNISTTTTINVTTAGGTVTSTTVPSSPQAINLPSIAAGSSITVRGQVFPSGTGNNTCGLTGNYLSSTSNGSQVWTLLNGDTPPNFAPYGNQANIDAFLKNYLDANGKIKIANNQAIYLFELGTTNTAATAYDMQDLVVLATISPTGY